MKKKLSLICSVLALSIALSAFTGCKPDQGTVEEKVETVEFSFVSNLSEAQAEYPVSTGTTYYISSSKGNDNYNGLSENTPFKTIKQLNRLSLNPGDTIAFKCGEMFAGASLAISNSGTEENPITICSYGEGAKPKLLAQQYDGIKFTNVSNLVIRDLEIIISGAERVSGNTPAQVYGISGYYDDITVKYENIYIINNTIHGSKTQSSSGVKISAWLSKNDNYQNLLSNVHIKHNEVYDLGMAGIFTDSWLYDWTPTEGAMNADPETFANVYVNENVTYNIAQIPIYLECCHDSEMNRNYVYDSAMGINGNAWLNIGQCGIMALGCTDTDIMYNEIYNIHNANIYFDGMGIDIDWNCKRVNVQYNHTYDCTGSGIGTMANVDCTILNNRVENNDCAGKQIGQIDCIDYTNRNTNVPLDMHVVRNILIKDNLIVNDRYDRVHFGARNNGGDGTMWSGNVFESNHLVSTVDVSDERTRDYFINVDDTVGWYKFANNKYYRNNTDKFLVMETTDSERMNTVDGAIPFDGYGFESWAKRDLGATFEVTNNNKPSAIKNVKVDFSNGKVNVTWDNSTGDLWHYNVYLTSNPEQFDYTTMLGEAFTNSYSHTFQAKGEYYLIIQPESNQGHYGTHTIIKITLN